MASGNSLRLLTSAATKNRQDFSCRLRCLNVLLEARRLVAADAVELRCPAQWDACLITAVAAGNCRSRIGKCPVDGRGASQRELAGGVARVAGRKVDQHIATADLDAGDLHRWCRRK